MTRLPKDITLTNDDGWLTLSTRKDPRGLFELDAPGLWKRVGPRQVFDVPLGPLMDRLDDEQSDVMSRQDIAEALVTWALGTRSNGSSKTANWTPPAREQLDEVAGDLSFNHGALVGQASIVTGPDLLALRLPIAAIADAMPAPRGEWLDQVIEDTCRLRMVRLGIRNGDKPRSLEAQIDLSGAPSWAVNGLLAIAIEVLRNSYVVLARTAAFVGDTACLSIVLNASPNELWKKPISTERKRK